MLESLLIANRGEIACRIIRTCRRLGIAAVAVYSDADRGARHVRLADQAVRLGPADAASSYLRPELIVEAALRSGAQAVHPGYGFLSESAALPRLCQANGLTWVGPRAEVIEAMGSKIESKRIALAAGVPVVAGYHGENQDPVRLLSAAQAIGFPVLIKASAGGGGKGMRCVAAAADFARQLQAARHEALRAFGDDRVLLEKLIERPRHLEVQLAGDRHGNLVHLFERECSIQRNYQKLIEEAPAPGLSEAVRERLYDYALRLGRQIGYDNLGTVEFVLGQDGDEPCFLEMNTRLQVEHPVTEQITGLDLVELQLRIAGGEPLPWSQQELVPRGCAIEARINCEDPAQDFRPDPGPLRCYAEPALEGVRVESGVDQASVVTPHYDAMIAKLIGSGATRTAAIRRLDAALAQFEAGGLNTNQLLLREVLASRAFREGALSTAFLAEHLPASWSPPRELRQLAAVAAAFCALPGRAGAAAAPWQEGDGFRLGAAHGAVARYTVTVGAEAPLDIGLRREAAGWRAELPEAAFGLQAQWLDQVHLRLSCDDHPPLVFAVFGQDGGVRIGHQGVCRDCRVQTKLQALAEISDEPAPAAGELKAALPGIVTAVHVRPGQAVEAGEVLAAMEAMKLIYQLRAPQAGHVAAVHCEAGQTVTAGQTLIRLVAVADQAALEAR